MSYPNYVYSLFAFIGFLLAIIPLPWHLNALNAGTCLYMLWTAIACLNQFINSVVWNGNVINWAPVWCDISSRIILGSSFAIPACSLCINRRLYRIARMKSAIIPDSEKRRVLLIDLAIGLGLPLLGLVLAYIPQGHRFDILEDIGCYPSGYVTPVSIVLVNLPPVLIGCVTGVYSVLTIYEFHKRREELKGLFSKLGYKHQNADMTASRYVRLMVLAGIEVTLTVPLGSFAIYKSWTQNGIRPWVSFSDAHYNFSRVQQTPAIFWRFLPDNFESLFEFNRWQILMCSFIFFAFFGLAEDARHNYRRGLRITVNSLRRLAGYAPRVIEDPESPGMSKFQNRNTRRKTGDLSELDMTRTISITIASPSSALTYESASTLRSWEEPAHVPVPPPAYRINPYAYSNSDSDSIISVPPSFRSRPSFSSQFVLPSYSSLGYSEPAPSSPTLVSPSIPPRCRNI